MNFRTRELIFIRGRFIQINEGTTFDADYQR